MGYYKCCCGNNCSCAFNATLTVSGVTDIVCTNTLNVTEAGLALIIDTASVLTSPAGVAVDCSTGGFYNAPWSTTPRNVNGVCGVVAGANHLFLYVRESDQKICVEIMATAVIGGILDVGRYHWVYVSAKTFDRYAFGETIPLTYDSLIKTGIDHGLVNMPHDGSAATVEVVINSCCSFCKDSVPAQMSVEIIGVTNAGGCTDCGTVNAVYVLDNSTPNRCRWSGSFPLSPDPTCGAGSAASIDIELLLSTTTVNETIQVNAIMRTAGGASLDTIVWRKITTTLDRFNCASFSAVSLARLSSGTFCTTTGSTVEVTSL